MRRYERLGTESFIRCPANGEHQFINRTNARFCVENRLMGSGISKLNSFRESFDCSRAEAWFGKQTQRERQNRSLEDDGKIDTDRQYLWIIYLY